MVELTPHVLWLIWKRAKENLDHPNLVDAGLTQTKVVLKLFAYKHHPLPVHAAHGELAAVGGGNR